MFFLHLSFSALKHLAVWIGSKETTKLTAIQNDRHLKKVGFPNLGAHDFQSFFQCHHGFPMGFPWVFPCFPISCSQKNRQNSASSPEGARQLWGRLVWCEVAAADLRRRGELR